MKFTFDVPELQKRLSQLAAVIKQKSPEPIYGFVRLFADADGVKLQGIDIDTTLTVKLPGASSDSPNASILLPYGQFARAVAALRTKLAFVSYETEQVAILSNTGKFKGKLEGAPTDKFANLPVVLAIGERPELGGYSVGLPGLKEQIEQVEFAVPKADGKFVVPSALLESTATEFRVVATDGVRLAISNIPANLGEFKFVVPKPALELLKKLDGTSVSISDTEGVFFFTTELELLTYSKTHSEFPAYHRVVPKDTFPTSVTINSKEEFLAAFNATKEFCDAGAVAEGKKGMRFLTADASQVLSLVAIKEEKLATGDIYSEMASDEISGTVTGPKNALRLDVQFVEQFVTMATFPITIFIKNAQSVTDFHANGGTPAKPTYRYLVMPMRGGDGAATTVPVEPSKK